jgi:hypothetical protein
MGFFQATNGIDSKANVQVTGSISLTGNINLTNLFATNISASGTISGSNISASNDIVAGNNVYVKGMDTLATGFTSAVNTVVVRSATTGELLAMPSSSFQIPPTVIYDGQTGGTASYDANSTPSISQLMNGVINMFPNTNPMLELDFSTITTDYKVEIISYGTGVNAERMNLQIRTPNTGNGWDGWLTGYYTDVVQSVGYQWITTGNGNTLFNTLGAISRRLDSSSRTLISIDIQLKEIIVHCTNISD